MDRWLRECCPEELTFMLKSEMILEVREEKRVSRGRGTFHTEESVTERSLMSEEAYEFKELKGLCCRWESGKESKSRRC